jgi:nicotinate-nucleotide pyrophosphorylase (carboxylating)
LPPVELPSIDFKTDTRILSIIKNALEEDIGPGDHSSMASVSPHATGVAKLLFKDNGIVAGIDLAETIFHYLDPQLEIEKCFQDGDKVKNGKTGLIVKGNTRSILQAERLVLNFMQRLSGIATATNELTQLLAGLKTRILDTRKTTPGLRLLEKWAVATGGGFNHRFGLYDMIMLKDNHIDAAGGISNAILQTRKYLQMKQLPLKVEIETRTLAEVNQVIEMGGVDRIMLDNFELTQLKEAVKLIDGRFETEASGGITKDTIRSYAECGVDFISVGAITHSVKSLDISLKIVLT